MANHQWAVVGFVLLSSSFVLLMYLSNISSTNGVLFDFTTSSDAVEQRAMSTQSKLYKEFVNGSEQLSTLLQSACVDEYAVPNIVHYVWLSKTTLEFKEYISMLSADKFVKPCYILLHGDMIPEGKWWDLLLSQVHNIIHVIREPQEEIFGRKLGCIEHKSDIMRLQILMEYGGIYANTDVCFLRSFDSLRNFTFVLGRENTKAVANGLIIGNKDSAFLKMWHLTYHTYYPKSWGNKSMLMASSLQNIFPGLVHIEPELIMQGDRFDSAFTENVDWGSMQYSVHARFSAKRDLQLEDVKTLNNSFGSLTRYVVYG